MMGNIMEGVPVKHDHMEETTNEILEELKDLMEIVDHSLAGLAKSVDSMQAACEMFLYQYENSKQDSLSPSFEGGVKGDTHLALYLLRTINESVYDHKFITMGSFTKLLKFIKETVNKHVNTTFGEELHITVDKYNKNKEVSNSTNGISYCDSRIEELSKEKERLNKINLSQKKQIQSLNAKYDALVDENGRLIESIKTLENRIRTLEEEIGAMKKDRSDIINENEDKERQIWNLEKQIETMNKRIKEKENVLTANDNDIEELQRAKEVLQVKIDQLISESKQLSDEKSTLDNELQSIKRKKVIRVQMNKTYSPQYEDDLIKLLKSRIQSSDLKLEITVSLLPRDPKDEIPTLYLCYSSSRQAAAALNELKEKSKVVVLIVHTVHRENEVDSVTSSNVKETIKTSGLFGEIYDMAYKFREGFLQCKLNEKSIESVVNFIHNEGVKISRLKLFLDSVSEEEGNYIT